MTWLRRLIFGSTVVSKDAKKMLQESLPNCSIKWL